MKLAEPVCTYHRHDDPYPLLYVTSNGQPWYRLADLNRHLEADGCNPIEPEEPWACEFTPDGGQEATFISNAKLYKVLYADGIKRAGFIEWLMDVLCPRANQDALVDRIAWAIKTQPGYAEVAAETAQMYQAAIERATSRGWMPDSTDTA